jgi:hypothetical protein
MFQKTRQVLSTLPTDSELYTTLLNPLWSRNLPEQKYIMHWLSPFFYMEAKFGPSEKKDKKTPDINPDENFQNNSKIHPFWPKK